MTYPTEFYEQKLTIGPTNLKHPIYSFKLNLDVPSTEVIGPNTNQSTVTPLQPDQYQSSPDQGRVQATPRDLTRVTWLPGLLASGNVFLNDDGTITAYGMQGKYLKDNYTTGPNPLLTLTNSPPYTTP